MRSPRANHNDSTDDALDPALCITNPKRRRRRSQKRPPSPSDITFSADSVEFGKIFDFSAHDNKRSRSPASSMLSSSTGHSPVFEKTQGKYPALDNINSLSYNVTQWADAIEMKLATYGPSIVRPKVSPPPVL